MQTICADEYTITNFMVAAKMALLGSTSLARLASETASPKGWKQETGVYSTT